jgi:uncharacterized protein (TIGR02300 family)
MAKPEWGIKRVCQSCTARYYDMKKNPPTCPKCGTVYNLEAAGKPKRGRPTQEESNAKKAQLLGVRDDTELDDVVILDDDEVLADEFDDSDIGPDDTGIEDASELGDDDINADVAR